MNPLKQLFGQTAVYGFGTVVPRMLSYLLLTPFFTRVFELGEYGVVTELYAYVVFLMIILTYGMETGFFRYSQISNNSEIVFSTSCIALLSSSLVFVIIVSIFSGSIASFAGYEDNPEYMVWIGFIVGIDAFTSIPFARLRRDNRAMLFAGIKIASVIVNIGLNFLFLYFLPNMAENGNLPEFANKIYNAETGVGYVFISNLIASVFTLVMLSGTMVRIKLSFDRDLMKRMLGYSLPLLIAGLAGTVNEALDRVLLKHLLPNADTALEQLGIYGANYKIAVLLTLFIQMFRYASDPFYFGNSDKQNSKEIFASVMKYFIITTLVIYLGVTLYLDIFKHFIGKSFHEGLHIVPVVLLANILLGVFYNLSIWYKLNNLTRYGAMITFTGALITIAINWIFIPVYGYTASAWAHVACYGSMVLISWSLGRKHYRIIYPLKSILFYVSLATGVYLIAEINRKYNEAENGLLINTALFAGFVIIVILKERKNLKEINFKEND